MGFAQRYIQRNIIYPEFISDPVDYSLGIVVVIPVFNEPEVLGTLNALAKCDPPNQQVEVLMVVNQSETSPPEVVSQNQQTVTELQQWKNENKESFFSPHIITAPSFPKKHAGAGMARKTGMDEAVRRFAAVERPDGIIVSLDADTLVDKNYFVEIEKHFQQSQTDVGACIQFKHRIEEIEDVLHKQGMQLYEKYLHYYKKALAFTGYPHAIYTVGSAFAVKADAYVKQGGMNRRQAGEDFYFLHKLSQLGDIAEINSTCVCPSARISNRVPFGTGPALQKWMDGDKTLKKTYSFQAFQDLKSFFELILQFFEQGIEECLSIANSCSKPIVSFLIEDNFLQALEEIKSNSSSLETFQKRFFQYFNAFKILKFLNYSHPVFYEFQDLDEAYEIVRK